MDLSALKREKLSLIREQDRRKAKSSLFHFIYYVNYDYRANWHHKAICDELQRFWEDPKQKRLMLFVPPQHGKSEIASKHFPAWVFGQNPDVKIAAASYSIDLARSFNRDVQRIIDTKDYSDVFPDTYINSKNVVTVQNWLRNSEEFEIVDHKGSYKSVGVMGGLSGRRVDLAIIDDPVKDALEANSETYRNRVWDWYVSVLMKRLHNKSKVVLIMTRWHEDDLAGRLLERQPGQWNVIKFPAIKEYGEGHLLDPRQTGEALWEERHSLEKLLEEKALDESAFEALNQQNPTTPGGNKVKDEWWEYCEEKELPGDIVWDLWIDGAYTKRTENDPTGLMIAGYSKSMNKAYMRHAHDAYMESPELTEHIKEYALLYDLREKSRVYFEPKASGKSIKQYVNKARFLNCVEIKNHLVSEGKEARLQCAAPKVQAGKWVLIRGNWNQKVIKQIGGYPKVKHDEYVDLIGYASYQYFDSTRPHQRRIAGSGDYYK